MNQNMNHAFLHFLFCWSILCHVISKEELIYLSVCTLDLACNLFRLKSFPSKRYRIGIPLLSSWKASVSMAENIILNSVEASTHPLLNSICHREWIRKLPSFWTLASIPSWNCCTIAMNLAGQPNFAIIFQSPS